jgi:ribosomal protein L11 methyltransferase
VASSWWEIQVLGPPALEELVFWRLQTIGCQGTVSQSVSQSASQPTGQLQGQLSCILAYLPQLQFDPLDLAALSLQLRQDATAAGFAAPTVNWRLIHEQDWATSWQQYWHPQPIGERLLIYPAWLPLPEINERLLLRLDPGVAFGTGNHATTQLCLESLEMHFDRSLENEDGVGQDAGFRTDAASRPVNPTLTIADIGCGSGILSIGALLLGAHQVYAVDTDPLAVGSARGSRDLNQISADAMVVEEGSVAQIPHLVDGIVCNILAEVIVQLLPDMPQIARPGTWGIFSGILVRQTQQVTNALEAQGWQVGSIWKKEDWACINAKKH